MAGNVGRHGSINDRSAVEAVIFDRRYGRV